MTTLQWISLGICLIAGCLVIWGYLLFVRNGKEERDDQNIYGRFE